MNKKNTYKKKYVLLDAHALIHRAYHALPDFSTKSGMPTGALYGLTTMIVRVLNEFKPEYIIACYDLPEPTFRHIAYSDYKGTRKKIDDILVSQLIQSKRIFEAFSIPIFEASGFEADDVIGTLSCILKQDPDSQIIIVSGDMDTMQLIEKDQVVVYTLKKGITDTILYTEKDVQSRYGFSPKAISEYKGLRGDTSDNIIGIRGIGEKTATHLITLFGTIEKMYKELKKGDLYFKTKTGLSDRLIILLKDNEDEALFSKELATIRLDVPLVVPEAKLHKEMFNLDKVKSICAEFEFRSLIPRIQTIYGDNTLFHQTSETILVKQKVEKKYLLALALLDSENTKPTDEDFWNYTSSNEYEECCLSIEADLKKESLFSLWQDLEVPLLSIVEDMSRYGILVDLPYLKNLSAIYHKEAKVLEKKIIDLAGVSFNINSPKQLGEVLFEKLQIQETGETVLKIKKTASGTFSTKETDLMKFQKNHPIVGLVLEYRELQKLLSTYIDSLPKQIKEDGRIHSTFNQLGASTGRFASLDPNLQNIPIKTEKGKAIRQAFIASPKMSFIACDYSQIELRVAAFLSGDPFMLQAFTDKADIHTRVAMQVFGVNEKDITSEMRRRAKIINFGILYGMGANALAENLSVSKKEAQAFLDAYKKEIPVFNTYLENVIIKTRTDKYTRTFFGRKRNFNKISSPLPFIKAMYERMAINAPIQGTAADIIKYAMLSVHQVIHTKQLQSNVHLMVQIHDEIIFEVRDECIDQASMLIKQTMENVLIDFVSETNLILPPLEVHLSVAKNMSDLK